jgi:hypothetical protein
MSAVCLTYYQARRLLDVNRVSAKPGWRKADIAAGVVNVGFWTYGRHSSEDRAIG